ncbi:DUF5916 domain-containing protein [Acidobacteriota bacterium]
MGFIWTILLLFMSTTAGGRGIDEGLEAKSKPEDKSTRNDRIEIHRLKGPITLDGLSDEPAWEGVESLPLVMFMPNFGKQPSQRTEALIAYDDDYLYVAGRLFDNEPSKIQSNSKQRDSPDPSSDWFGIVIDSYNDKENALTFFTTPAGLRWDAEVTNDALEPNPYNLSWNTFWDVATVQNEEGWFAEIRIPFSSLRFQDRDGQVVMGIIIRRRIARNDEWDVYPAIPPNWGSYSTFKPSKAKEALFQEVYSRSPLYVAPYLLGGLGQSTELNESETALQQVKSVQREAGLDIKYGLTSNLTLDVTVNTDFAQVEADDEQINLTRFSLFFPEKRLFFQERSGIFEFDFSKGDKSRLFYSRRIGINEGEIVRIYGGVRLVGRVGPWDLGFLNMHTAPEGSLPSENFGVFRVRRQVFNPYSYIGAMTTTRIGVDGSYNVAYGLDTVIRLFGDDYLTVKWAQTFASGLANNPLSLDPARFRLNWRRRSSKGWGYAVSIERAGDEYEPGVGFELRDDFSKIAVGLIYGWIPGPSSRLFNHQVSLTGISFLRNANGDAESFSFSTGWHFRAKSGWRGQFTPILFFENVTEDFDLSEEAEVPAGRYTFGGIHGELSNPSGSSRYLSMTLDLGSFYDGWRTSFGLGPRWNVSPDLELSATYQLNRISFSERGQRFHTHIGRIRALYMMSTKFSATAFVQYNSAIDAVIANVRFRYNPREGIDLYVVYNEALNTIRRRDNLVYPLSNDRTFLLKYRYTFNF